MRISPFAWLALLLTGVSLTACEKTDTPNPRPETTPIAVPPTAEVVPVPTEVVETKTPVTSPATKPSTETETKAASAEPELTVESLPTASDDTLQTLIVKEGSGVQTKAGDNVIIHYAGKLMDGTTFDSSREKNTPFHFTIGGRQVIPGMDQGVTGMRVGEIRHLVIPPKLGYGDRTMGPIPANSVLIFEVELLEIRSLQDVIKSGLKKQ